MLFKTIVKSNNMTEELKEKIKKSFHSGISGMVFTNKKSIDIEFEIGQIVYLKMDDRQHARMVVGINIRPTGLIYVLAFESSESVHYGIEISAERDVVKATSN